MPPATLRRRPLPLFIASSKIISSVGADSVSARRFPTNGHLLYTAGPDMSGPYKPTQREYAMENLNTQMDDQLKNRVAELNRANDENRDGRLDAADLKAQLNRIEAQLELQDQQNRGIIANQRKRMVLSVVLDRKSVV